VLSDLQRRVAAILADLPEASGFVLAGGGALIAHGDVDRLTRDLDFFTVEPAQVDELLPVLEFALRAVGWEVIEQRVAPGFARLMVVDGDERTGVDLATDARLLPAEPSELGLILSTEELAVDRCWRYSAERRRVTSSTSPRSHPDSAWSTSVPNLAG
jgi:hypothetical protein